MGTLENISPQEEVGQQHCTQSPTKPVPDVQARSITSEGSSIRKWDIEEGDKHIELNVTHYFVHL